jgi:chromosome segregation ATPase
MFKKITLGVVAVALLAGLAFGGNLVPYSKTAYNKLKNAANDSVPVSFQLDAARDQLQAIGPEIKSMVHEVAKEKVQINKLVADLEQHDKMLASSYDEMMALRSHLESGQEYYVAINKKKFNKSRVEEDLRHRFNIYKTAKATKEKKEAIVQIRQASLENALAKLDQAKSQQRELEVQIENLTARNRMNEVIASASELNIDSSQLAKARQMLSDLDVSISANEEYLNIMPNYRGQIPVSSDSLLPATNVLEEMDVYFGDDDSPVKDTSDVLDDEV